MHISTTTDSVLTVSNSESVCDRIHLGHFITENMTDDGNI